MWAVISARQCLMRPLISGLINFLAPTILDKSHGQRRIQTASSRAMVVSNTVTTD